MKKTKDSGPTWVMPNENSADMRFVWSKSGEANQTVWTRLDSVTPPKVFALYIAFAVGSPGIDKTERDEDNAVIPNIVSWMVCYAEHLHE